MIKCPLQYFQEIKSTQIKKPDQWRVDFLVASWLPLEKPRGAGVRFRKVLLTFRARKVYL